LTLKLKVGKKGYIIIPKAIREAVGIEEGDEVIVEVNDAIIINLIKKAKIGKIREALEKLVERIRSLKERKEPSLGELAGIDLEEEFGE